jgi:hypothetical protein
MAAGTTNRGVVSVRAVVEATAGIAAGEIGSVAAIGEIASVATAEIVTVVLESQEKLERKPSPFPLRLLERRLSQLNRRVRGPARWVRWETSSSA